MTTSISRNVFTKWKKNTAEYLSVLTVLLRETKYLCPKCRINIDISTAHCSHIISCKTLDQYKAYPLAININNLTICCKTCNLKQGSKPEKEMINSKLNSKLSKYSIVVG